MKKNFAIWAKRKMYADIVIKAKELGIMCDDFEEVTYTWFIRIVAIRYMEINNFFNNIRVLSSSRTYTDTPDIIDMPFKFGIKFSNDEKEKIINLKKDNRLDELFCFLFIKECNELGKIIPIFFDKTDEVKESLLTISYLDKNGVVYRLLHDIDESEFDITSNGKIEIIGWIYQNYNSDAKAEAFSMLKNNKKIDREHIPAATQLFTPEWIVKYMVENSIGRVEKFGDNCGKFMYFLPGVVDNFDENQNNRLENIKVIDPCMGSGHILVYVFDCLFQIYIRNGYKREDAAKLILENNIFGADIDKRAYSVAYFALMMKAWQYDNNIFSKNVRNGLCYIQSDYSDNYCEEFWLQFEEDILIAKKISNEFILGDLYGTLLDLDISRIEYDRIKKRVCNMPQSNEKNRFIQILRMTDILLNKYDIVITNPPYMGKKSIDRSLAKYLEKYYEAGKSELYAAFMLKCKRLCKEKGYVSMLTIHSWMFISSFEKLRNEILNNMTIINMVHLGAGTFEELNSFNALAVAFVFRNEVCNDYISQFVRLTDYHSLLEKKNHFGEEKNIFYLKQSNFRNIPGSPIVYWISKEAANAFVKGQPLRSFAKPRQGMATANNDVFVRNWFEVKYDSICFGASSNEEAALSDAKWFPYNKGGKFRKWYGMNICVVDWENGGRNLKKYKRAVLRNTEYYFKSGLTWSLFGFENFSIRYKEQGYLFDVSGSSMFPSEDIIYYILGFLASKVSFLYLSILAPTVNFQVGNVGDLPLIICNNIKDEVEKISKECIDISREEWDENEISWNYDKPPFLNYQYCTLKEQIDEWIQIALTRYYKLIENEERINKLFIDGYGLQNDLKFFVNERDIGIKKPNIKEAVKQFVSYVVGVMFGRYLLESKYETVKDNVIVITGTNKFIENDIIYLFEKVVAKIFGSEYVEVNIKFIANVLCENNKHSSRDSIRDYFSKQFFYDHCKLFQKKPIYWMIDSGKKKAFRALIYYHRYNKYLLRSIEEKFISSIIQSDKDKKEEFDVFSKKISSLANMYYEINYDNGIINNYNMIQIDKDGVFLEILERIP